MADKHISKANSSQSSSSSSAKKSRRALLEMKKTLDQLQDILNKKEDVLRQRVAIMEDLEGTASRSASSNSSHGSVSGVSASNCSLRHRQSTQKESKFSIEDFFERWETPNSDLAPITPKHQARSFSPQAPPIDGNVKTEALPSEQLSQVAGNGTQPLADDTRSVKMTGPRGQQPARTQSASDNDINRLARAIQSAVTVGISKTDARLPSFDGNPKDWLQFKASFTETTARFNIAPDDNILRLRAALKGEARATVAALLHSCADPQVIIDTLQLRFGHPARLVRDQINEIRSLKAVSSEPHAISEFSCKISNCVAVIRSLGMEEYLHSTELYESAVSKLNTNLKSRWTDYAATYAVGERGTLSCLSDFLRREAELALRYLPELSTTRPATQPSRSSQQVSEGRYSVHAATTSKNCTFCNEPGHNVAKCEKFIELTVPNRMSWAKENQKCFRCLIFNHPAKRCRIAKSLHKLLRPPLPGNAEAGINTIFPNIGAALKVLPVTVSGPKGSFKAFALLDEGASISLIDSSLAEKIGAPAVGNLEKINIQGIGTHCQAIDSVIVPVTISTAGNNFNLKLRTMKNLNLQCQHLDKEKALKYDHIKQVEHFIDWYTDGTPQLLIGQDYWHLIVSRELFAGEVSEPVVSRTLLGYVIHGNINCMRASINCCYHVTMSRPEDELHSLVKQSFDLDTLGIKPQERTNPLTEKANHILNSTTKRRNGSWETGLLWAHDSNVFPETRLTSLKRFHSLEKTFHKDPEFAKAYTAQVNRLFELGYAERLDEQSVQSCNEWVLPHFAVTNPNKPGKVRVVYDCASKVKGQSLNDYLLTGPELLQSLLGVLWRFRQRRIAIAADIKDMFLKIRIREEDQQFQKFYWREPGSTSPPQLCVMTSMLFGAKCSPSSAIYVKNRNAQDFIKEYPEAVQAIEKNHYCDDYLDSYNSEQEAIEMATNVIKIHACGNFDICNWASNSPAVLQSISENKRSHSNVEIGWEELKERTLGMIWQPSTDTLSFNLSMKKIPKEVADGSTQPTKRQVLAVIASIFDPIGLLSHFTIRGKILLQDIWRSGISWDEPLKEPEVKKWQAWLTNLQAIRECSIPRCYAPHPDDVLIQLHTFCDASSQAYAATCYWRYAYPDGSIKVVLAAAKARVTPLKPCSIPRLELQAALLGARLADTVSNEHQLHIDKKFFWTDSGTTLAWIRSDPRSYKAYVSHRLAAIDDLTEVSQWKWVPTDFNSADIATRDAEKINIALDSPWFSGPEFLKETEDRWPVEKNKITPKPEAICEQKEIKIHVITKKEYSLPEVTSFSSWKRLIRATAYMLIFINRCKKEGETFLTLKLLEQAEKMWIRRVQEDCFTPELCSLKEKKNLPSDSKLLTLTPVLDEEGIMRLGGRINRAPDVPIEMKNPVILSGSHDYTKLLLHHFHKLYNHASTETVVNEVRQRYWVLKMRSSIRSVAHNCQYCKIKRATAVQPPMGDLPLARLQHHKRPFSFCGLDYFGPVEVSIGRRREKRWGALFTCLVTRAVHMEIAASLTADSVIMAIRRMAARRGWPTAIHSDNGTNFKGAEGELKKAWTELNKQNLADEMLSRGVEWHYIPANAPHMGGAWERLVQTIKRALSATLNERAPREEVLATLMTEAEHSVNSRPITFVSVNASDTEALTPNHFLIGSSSGMPRPGIFDDKDLMLKKQWKVAQRMADMFWKRWLKEYLPLLLVRKMKNKEKSNQIVKEGQPVIVMDYALPRNVWQRGIITKTFPGEDGTIRVVEVKTTGGSLRRPVNKVILLPVDKGSSSVNCLCGVMSRLCDAERRDREGRSDNPTHNENKYLPI